MRYLLDTHVLIWMRENDPRLPKAKWEPVFFGGEHEILFSLVSIWEISIKRRIGKLKIDGTTEDFARSLTTKHGFRQLPLELHEIVCTEKLPLHHRDPFDRLLISQTLETGATAVTNDPNWNAYPIKVAF